MSKEVAVLGITGHRCDLQTGNVKHQGGPSLSGNPRCKIGGRPVLCIGDKVFCIGSPPAQITSGHTRILVSGKAVACVGDKTNHNSALEKGHPRVKVGR